MKAIFFGLGSIGKRHLKNLQTLCFRKKIDLTVHAYRTNATDAVKDVKTVTDISDIDNDYDVAFVTNPTSLHYQTIQLLSGKVKFLFIEKPIFEKKYSVLDFKIDSKRCYIACPLRYKELMARVKDVISKEKIYSVRAICSTYLPDWRPTDYTKSYSALPELGGGVELDCIHEIDYIVDLFGLPSSVKTMFGKVSELNIRSNDTALYLLDYGDKYIEIHLDYYGRPVERRLEIITSTDKITVDLINNTLLFAHSGRLVACEEPVNKFYLNEMEYFLEQVMQDKENHNDLNHALAVLDIALGEIS